LFLKGLKVDVGLTFSIKARGKMSKMSMIADSLFQHIFHSIGAFFDKLYFKILLVLFHIVTLIILKMRYAFSKAPW